MIMISGAGGKTGRALLRVLAAHGVRVRALAHRPALVEPLRMLGAFEVTVGDMRLPHTWATALQGVTALYHICPNMSPHEEAIGAMALHAARHASVAHFVYHSVLHPHIEEMPHHWSKLRVEERIFAAGVPFTILQPAPYMQNVLATWDEISTTGIYRVPYALHTRLGMVDLHDVAEVAARVLEERGHEGAIYELAGPEVLDQAEVATLLAAGLARPVAVEAVPLDRWEQGARSTGLDHYAVHSLRAMFVYYERHGLWGSPHVLTDLLGRPPHTFRTFVDMVVRA